MALSCRCLDCGREFTAEKHEDQCGPCWENDTAMWSENRGLDLDRPLVPHSTRYYQERLSVSGREDS